MEDLLWKYIDNECSPQELEQINALLSSDESFKKMYDEFLQLDSFLVKNISTPLSETFANNLKDIIKEEVTIKQVPAAKSMLFNIQWVALTIFGVSAILISYLYPAETTQSNVFSDFMLSIDKDILHLLNVVVLSLVFMIFVDKALRYFTKIKMSSMML